MGPPPDGQTGSAKVFLRLDAQGGIAERKIEKSSGKKGIDAAALKTIDDSVPFPRPFPEVAADKKNLIYHITVTYRDSRTKRK